MGGRFWSKFIILNSWFTFNAEDAAFVINTNPTILGFDEKQHEESEGVIMYIKEKNLQNISKVYDTLKSGYYEDVVCFWLEK